jgi:predicted dehydrogenase
MQLRVGVAGVGHFGRYHAQKAASGSRSILAGIHDTDPARAAHVAAELGVPALSFPQLLAASDAVVIAAPAGLHHALGMAALDAGHHVLMEKPLAATLAEADALIARAAARGVVLQVGHVERFSAAWAALAATRIRPLAMEAVRAAPFKPRGTDVSVILDLMIHDLDLVLTLAASPLVQVDAVGAPVASAQVDMAQARLRFASGAVATLSASRVAPRTERRLRLFAADGYVSLDFANRTLVRRGRHGEAEAPGLPGLRETRQEWADHDNLAAEHAAFAAAVLDGAPVAADGAAGRAALDAALRIEAAMAGARAEWAASGLLDQAENLGGGGF